MSDEQKRIEQAADELVKANTTPGSRSARKREWKEQLDELRTLARELAEALQEAEREAEACVEKSHPQRQIALLGWYAVVKVTRPALQRAREAGLIV